MYIQAVDKACTQFYYRCSMRRASVVGNANVLIALIARFCHHAL